MPLYILCYRFFLCLFSRKPSYLRPSQPVGSCQIRLNLLTN